MRTTLTLDADVVRLLEEQVHRTRSSFKEVVNEALRRGLVPGAPRRARKRFRVVSHEAKLLPGLDRAGFNHLVDELEVGTFISANAKARRA